MTSGLDITSTTITVNKDHQVKGVNKLATALNLNV